MNKKSSFARFRRNFGASISQDKITLILDKAVEITKRTLEAGEPVKWSGFGSFIRRDIPPRCFYSMKLGEYVTSKGTKRITFIPSRTQ